jgi:hypothetical protein
MFLVLALPVTDEIGFALAALAIAIHVFRSRGFEAKRRAT